MAAVFKRCHCCETPGCKHTRCKAARCDHSWIVKWRDANGQQREKAYLPGQKTLANDLAVKVEHDKRAGVYEDPRPGNVLFGQYAEQRITHMDAADSTRQDYLSALRQHLQPIANRKLRDIANDREGVQELLRTLEDKGLGPSIRKTCLNVITGTCNEAVKARRIQSHQLKGIRVPAAPARADFHFATREETEKLAAGLPEEWAFIVWLGRGCGRRISEALAVHIDCFRDNNTVLRIHEQVKSGSTTGPLKHKKPGQYIDTPVPKYVADKLEDHLAKFGTHDGYLFKGHRVKFVTKSTWNAAFTKAREHAGMEGFDFHELRHAFASIALSESVPVTDVAAWLGHASIQVTYGLYAHLVPSTWARGREVLDKEWSG